MIISCNNIHSISDSVKADYKKNNVHHTCKDTNTQVCTNKF